MLGAIDLGLGRAGRFCRAFHGQHQAGLNVLQLQGQAGGQRAAYRAQLPRERQLSRKFPAGQPRGIDLPAGRQDAQGNRQVKTPTVFGQIGWREIDGDALVGGEFQPAVGNRTAHALPRLFDFNLGQPHQSEAGQSVGQMHFHGDRRRLQPQKRPALHAGQTHGVFLPKTVRKKAANAPSSCTNLVLRGDCHGCHCRTPGRAAPSPLVGTLPA